MIAHGYRVSFGDDEKIPESDSGDYCKTLRVTLKAIQLYILKG